MDKRELEYFIRQEEKRIEKVRNRRGVKATLGFSAVYVILLCWINTPSSFSELLAIVFIAPIFGFLHLMFNSVIFSQIFDRVAAENRYLEELKNKLNQ